MITLGNLTVTDDDLAVIAHVVCNETPEAWATRAFGCGGEAMIEAKIARHLSSWLAAKDDVGYKTAAEKMAAEDAVRDARRAQYLVDAAAAAVVAEEALDAKINAEVARQIAELP